MAATYVNGRVTSNDGTQDYDFLIVRGERHIGLPQYDIDSMRLKPSVFAISNAGSGGHGGSGNMAYTAWAEFSGNSIDLDVFPSEVPTVGVAVLRTLGFSVDLEDGNIKEPTTPTTIHRGLSPWSRPVGHDQVYVASHDGLMYSLDAANLEIAWHSKLLEGRTITHFVVANGKVYVALADGWVYALDAANLEMEWRNRLLEGETITHLSVASGRLYVASDDGGMYMLNGGNLELLMSATLPEGKGIANLATIRD